MAERVTVYGADWCGDTRRALAHLDTRKVQYEYINIDNDAAGEKKVIEFSKGKRRIPLVEIGDKAMAVPTASELDSALS